VANAKLAIDPPPGEWAALRLWAAGVRKAYSEPHRANALAVTLASVLDASEARRKTHPFLAAELWRTARLTADKIAEACR
jgi:hypothetical protein